MPDLKTIAQELREFAKAAQCSPTGIRIDADTLLEYATTLDAFGNIDQDRVDIAIARQLARSMKMNARLKQRLTALRSCVQTVMNIKAESHAFDLCSAALKQDDEMKAAND